MTDSMLAAQAYPGEHEFRLEQVPVPSPGRGEVVIRVESAAVTRGLLALWYFTKLFPLLPSPIGHEAAGTVARVGPGVTEPSEGDRVRVHGAITCGRCRWCRDDEGTLCPELVVIGYGSYNEAGRATYERYHRGALAEYMLVPAANALPLAESVSFDVGGKISTLAGSLGALRASTSEGDQVVISGATGASGVAAIRCAPLVGARRVLAVSRGGASLARASEMSPLPVETVATDELPDGWEASGALSQALRGLAGDRGADSLVDYQPLGTDTTIQCIMSLRPGGTAVLMGGSQAPLNLHYGQLMRNQYRIVGHLGTGWQAEEAVSTALEARKLRAEDLVTHRFPLEGVNEAVRAVFGRKDNPLFVVVNP